MFLSKNGLSSGVIIALGSGVVTLQGFLIAFIGEVFRISNSSCGLVVNLLQDNTMNLLVSALLFNPGGRRISEGAKVKGCYRLASIILGDVAIGSILDPLGNFILNS